MLKKNAFLIWQYGARCKFSRNILFIKPRTTGEKNNDRKLSFWWVGGIYPLERVWGRPDYNTARFAYRQGFCIYNFHLSRSYNFIISSPLHTKAVYRQQRMKRLLVIWWILFRSGDYDLCVWRRVKYQAVTSDLKWHMSSTMNQIFLKRNFLLWWMF